MKKEFEVICKNCGKKFTVIEEETKFPIKGDKYFCCRSCANTRHHSEEIKQKISNGVKTSTKYLLNNSINKKDNSNCFLKKEDIPQFNCKYCNKLFYKQYIFNGLYYKIIGKNQFCSKKCLLQFRSKSFIEINKKYNLGGFKEGSVKNYKSGWYKGIHCDSSWELAYLIYHLEHNNTIERCKEIRYYILNDKKCKYYPDFIVNGKIFEIKGIKSKNSEAKQLYNPDITFLYKKDMIKYLDYVINKYGIDFINLYDKKDK